MQDAGVDAGKLTWQEGWEPCWANQGIKAVLIAAAGAEPAAVLHRDRLIEAE